MNSREAEQLVDRYDGKRVLLTGATGFIGSHLLSAFGTSTARVGVITRNLPEEASGNRRYFVGDICDREFVCRVMQEWSPEVLFHLAGARDRALNMAAFDNAIEVNLQGTLNILFAARDAIALERAVVLGTGEEYGKNTAPFVEVMRELPISAYSFSKQCATHLSQLMYASFSLPVVVLRPSVAYGPSQARDMFLPALIQSLLQGEVFPMTPGGQTRDYVYVTDLVDALLRAGITPNIDGEIINVGSGEATQIGELVAKVESLLSITNLVHRGALEYRSGEPMAYQMDISKARQMLAWTPRVSLDDGLSRTVSWYLAQRAY